MDDFLKRLIELAKELDSAGAFHAKMIVGEMQMLYQKHINEITSKPKQEIPLPDFLYKDSEGVICTGCWGDTDVTEDWNSYLENLKERGVL